jgi:glutathione S-transferase
MSTYPPSRNASSDLRRRATALTVQVDLRGGEQFTPEFRAINPECTVPVLEFDDGRRIAKVIAIYLYFELAHPEPALMGSRAKDKAIVADWHHRVERQGFWAVGDAFRNSAPGLKGRALPGPDDTNRSQRSPNAAAPA